MITFSGNQHMKKKFYKNNVGCIIFMVLVYPEIMIYSCERCKKIMNKREKIYECGSLTNIFCKNENYRAGKTYVIMAECKTDYVFQHRRKEKIGSESLFYRKNNFERR